MNKILIACAVIAFFFTLSATTFAANPQPVKGGKLPVISLPIPKDPNDKMYLGLSGEGFFGINQIRAEALLINIFNLYCPICLATATAMGEIFHQIENNPDLKNKIKLIGIGAGNNVLEVEVFRQDHHLPFPIFPDENFKIHQVLGEVRTPFFIATKMAADGSLEIVLTHLGGITEARAFLDLMVEAYGIKQEDLLIKEAIPLPDESSSKLFFRRISFLREKGYPFLQDLNCR